MIDRKNFGKLKEVISPPNLIENQIVSFQEFLQLDTPASQRKPIGLEAVFREVFPIQSYDERCACARKTSSRTKKFTWASCPW
jgi:DNA-directed RNA polymerase subunit beta